MSRGNISRGFRTYGESHDKIRRVSQINNPVKRGRKDWTKLARNSLIA